MRTSSFVRDLRAELQKHSEPLYREQFQQFFKEQVKMFGVRTPMVREIARQFYQKVRRMKKKEQFSLCGQLLRSGQGEEATVAFDWAYRARGSYEPRDLATLERWLERFVSNWAACDDLCTHALGNSLMRFPAEVERVYGWARSPNRWMRRGAAIALIPGLRRSKFLKELFRVCDILLRDQEDLVQKGYGWALKEASNALPREVFHYVVKHKKEMPRVALRYAIEKMPAALRQQALSK